MSGEKPELKRVFIVGCPRSGTTLLQSLLSAHSEIISFPETHFFSFVFPQRRLRKMLGWVNPEGPRKVKTFLQEIQREQAIHLFPRHLYSISGYIARFIHLLDTIALEEAKSVWIEKTPRHLHYIGQIERYVPGAKFIHIVRDGVDVVASLYQVTHQFPEIWGGARTIDTCIERWVNDIHITKLHAGKPNHIVVSYKSLALFTDDTLKRLCNFLDIEFEETMETVYKKNVLSLVSREEKWKKNNQNDIRFIGGETAGKIFSSCELTYIQSQIKHVDIEGLL